MKIYFLFDLMIYEVYDKNTSTQFIMNKSFNIINKEVIFRIQNTLLNKMI